MKKTIIISMEGSEDALAKVKNEIQRILAEHTNSPHSTALPLTRSTISGEVYIARASLTHDTQQTHKAILFEQKGHLNIVKNKKYIKKCITNSGKK